jgi:hypothetical protein
MVEELAESEVRARVRRVSREGTMVNLGNSTTPFHQGVPSTQVRVFVMLTGLVAS